MSGDIVCDGDSEAKYGNGDSGEETEEDVTECDDSDSDSSDVLPGVWSRPEP